MEAKTKRYGLTICACFFGYILQAVVVNVSPTLFITLKNQFMLSYSQLGLLVLVNFVTQLTCDLTIGSMVDRIGFRPLALSSAVLAILGFLTYAVSPWVLPQNPYPGMFLGTVIFAIAGGLMEILLSPIINALPLRQEKKNALMGFVHSAYSWGQLIAVLATTLLLYFLGAGNWQWIFIVWCIVPFVVFSLFLIAPLEPGVPAEKQQNAKSVLLSRTFALCMVVMIAGGAGELIVGQWASSFLEQGLGVSKAVGDVLGVCAFAFAMSAGRLLYSKIGERLSIYSALTKGLWILFFCYLAIALVPGRIVPMVCVVLSGFGVAMTWPGTLVVASEKFPLAGSWMFAVLAAGGDTGCSFGPWLAGKLVDIYGAAPAVHRLAEKVGISAEQLSLRLGLLIGTVFCILGILALKKLKHKQENI
ncbi:MAG: MFS transporter [Clostridia bacterium]|nr:MFS transporter [Clostridia bacterium]